MKRSGLRSLDIEIPENLEDEIVEQVDAEMQQILNQMPRTPVGTVVDLKPYSWLGIDGAVAKVVGEKSTNAYILEIRKLHAFLELLPEVAVSANHLTDENLRRYVNDQATKLNFSISYKFKRAALNWYLKLMFLPLIDHKSAANAYPRTLVAFDSWLYQFKSSGKVSKSAGTFSTEAYFWVMRMETAGDPKLLALKSRFILMVANQYRAQECHQLFCCAITRQKATGTDHRCLLMDLSVTATENRLQRTKTVAAADANKNKGDVTNLLVCTCLVHLEDEPARRSEFANLMKRNPNCKCVVDLCPYGHIVNYLDTIPNGWDLERIGLKFCRALSPTGNPRTFTTENLGVNQVKSTFAEINEMLPVELKIANAGGHSGRHTGCSIQMESGASTAASMAGSHHKDLKSFNVYAAKAGVHSTAAKQEAQLHVATALKTKYASNSIAGVKCDPGDIQNHENHSDSLFREQRPRYDHGYSQSASSFSSAHSVMSVNPSPPVQQAPVFNFVFGSTSQPPVQPFHVPVQHQPPWAHPQGTWGPLAGHSSWPSHSSSSWGPPPGHWVPPQPTPWGPPPWAQQFPAYGWPVAPNPVPPQPPTDASPQADASSDLTPPDWEK